MMHKPCKYTAIAVLLFLPSAAHADAGSPLVFAMGFHLLIANALIGLLEGILLAWCLSLPVKRAIIIFIAANYCSAWVGTIATFFIASAIDIDIYNYWHVFTWLLAASFFITLLCETPFLVWLCRKSSCRWPKATLVFVMVQAASYALLVGWYARFSSTSLISDTVLVETSQITTQENMRLYYISDDDGDVYVQELSGQPVKSYDHELRIAAIDLRRNTQDAEKWDLIGWLSDFHRTEIVLKQAFCTNASQRFTQGHHDLHEWHISRWFGPALRVGSANESLWNVEFDVMGGMSGSTSDKTQRFRYFLDCPWAIWPLVNATHLPGDQIVFNLDCRQICLLDIHTKKLAVIARGSYPVVVLAETPPAEQANFSNPAR